MPVEQPTKFEIVINLKDREADRRDDTAECAGARGQGHQMKEHKLSPADLPGLRRMPVLGGSRAAQGSFVCGRVN